MCGANGRSAQDQSYKHKRDVTERIQQRVVNAFLASHPDNAFFRSIDDGLSFLRGHRGNFPSHVPELEAAAQYVKYTAHCVRGPLRAGDELSRDTLAELALIDPRCAPPRAPTSLGAVLARERRPLLIVASSYT